MSVTSRLYFHAPCFDGVASAVLALDYLEGPAQWRHCELVPAGNDVRKAWLNRPLAPQTAVVDFPYHPDAAFWADHHQTAFGTTEAERSFCAHETPWLVYDPAAGSCAGLLWRHLLSAFDHRIAARADLVWWAEKIDAARYSSVDEALDASSPALEISASLGDSATDEYSIFLVRSLQRSTLETVAALPEVAARSARVRSLQREGESRMRKSIRTRDGIAVFDVDAHGVVVNRYSPYRFVPDANYSIGIVRDGKQVKIAAMRNPWKEFESVPLGRIFRRYGGGGHQRVASLYLRDSDDATNVLERIIDDVREASTRKG